MSDHIILDIETKTLLEGKKLTEMEVSCAVVYNVNDHKYSVYGDTKGELKDLRSRIDLASRVTTWGGEKFDLPIIYNKLSFEETGISRFKSDDLRRRVYLSQQLDPMQYDPNKHGGWSLDKVSKETLGVEGKSGNGKGAPALYTQGLWGRLIDYCIQDVKLTRDLVWFADKYGYLLGADGMYARVGKDWLK
jgi:hypothetical protein